MTRAAVLGVILAGLLASPASAAPGVLDRGWASDGVFTGSTFVEPYDGQQVISVDAQGRTLLAVTEDIGENQKPADDVVVVSRLTSSGALDSTFNPSGPTPGTVTLDFAPEVGASSASAYGIQPGPGGTIVVLAQVYVGGGPRIGLARLLPEGGYDPALDTNGRAAIDLPAPEYNPSPEALLVDSAGRMLVAGVETGGVNNKGFVARITPAGVLDVSWNGDGIARVGGAGTGPPDVQLHVMTPGPGGGVVAAGQFDADALAVELDANGMPVAGFGAAGLATSDFAKPSAASTGWAHSVAVDSLDRVVIGGQMTLGSGLSGPARATLVRFTPAGAADASWGTGSPTTGVVQLPTPAASRVTGLFVSSGDRMVVSAFGANDPDGAGPAGAVNAAAIGRLLVSGALDPSFGTNGITTTAVGGSANAFGVVSDAATSRLLQVGYRQLATGFDVRPFILAYTDDGSAATPPDTKPPPALPPVTTPPRPPGTPPAKPAAPTFASFVSLPSARRCASRRNFAIRLRVPKGAAVTQAVVRVDGKQVTVRRGDRLRSTVNLRSLPKGRFTVTITLRLRSGKTLSGKRVYHTCVARRKGGKPKL